ncbi:MAG: ferredoxin [Actinobacteria bacterium]|nr:ferredoxin [Actinomycetota bacterium]
MGGIKLKITEVKIDREKCIGTGNCVDLAPRVFELDDEGKSTVINKSGAGDETLKEAAQSCPVEAITLIGEDGRQIWP